MKNLIKNVILPICVDEIACVTSCWIYNRLAIIKTSPYYEDWIASHYSLYSDSGFNFQFGETFLFLAGYHDAILERRPLHLFHYNGTNVINKLKEEITMGYYIVMHIKHHKEKSHVHEVLFYGYDDLSSSLFAVGVIDYSFKLIQYSYSHIENTLADVQEYFSKYPCRSVYLSIYFQYPATAFRLNKNYTSVNCPVEAYHKLREELTGKRHLTEVWTDFGSYKEDEEIYRGISCLYRFGKMVEKKFNDEKFPESFVGIRGNAKKLEEHQGMVLHSMKYLEKKWNSAISIQGKKCIIEYEQCYRIVKKWLGMVIKYECTGEKNLLKKIMVEAPVIFDEEKKILDSFLHEGINWEIFNKNFV